jgi:hypothetical protein
MTGRWTKEDQAYWDKPENRLLFEFNCLWTSKNYWDRNPDNSKRMDEDLRKLFKTFFEKESSQLGTGIRIGDSSAEVVCGRIKECRHFLGLAEKLDWLKESDIHDLLVSMIKMRIGFLEQDDDVKKAMTDTLKNLINEKEPSA